MDVALKSQLLTKLTYKLKGELQAGTVGTDALHILEQMVETANEPIDRPISGVCTMCGQRIRKLNPHRMDAAKVKLLREIARRNAKGFCWIKVQRDGTLISFEERPYTIQCDDVHALRLSWFGLVEKKGRRLGEYRVNEAGKAFLEGKKSVPAKIWCRDGKVFEESTDKVYIQDVKNVILDKEYWDSYTDEQKVGQIRVNTNVE